MVYTVLLNIKFHVILRIVFIMDTIHKRINVCDLFYSKVRKSQQFLYICDAV